MNWQAILRALAPRGDKAILDATARAMPGVASEFDLNSDLRLAHFLAQLAHESAGFRTTVEYASGAAYEGRRDLGNTEPGDGKRFKGRGLIQLTGRSNYAVASKALGVDFVGNPQLAAQFPHALRVAGWYWRARKINAKADEDNLFAVSALVNGVNRKTGQPNHLKERGEWLDKAKRVLAQSDELPAVKPKTMVTSKTNNAAIAGAVAGSVAPAVEALNQVKAATDTISGIVQAGPWVLLIIALLGLAYFIYRERKRKLDVEGV